MKRWFIFLIFILAFNLVAAIPTVNLNGTSENLNIVVNSIPTVKLESVNYTGNLTSLLNNLYVEKSGDTMTGGITYSNDITNPFQIDTIRNFWLWRLTNDTGFPDSGMYFDFENNWMSLLTINGVDLAHINFAGDLVLAGVVNMGGIIFDAGTMSSGTGIIDVASNLNLLPDWSITAKNVSATGGVYVDNLYSYSGVEVSFNDPISFYNTTSFANDVFPINPNSTYLGYNYSPWKAVFTQNLTCPNGCVTRTSIVSNAILTGMIQDGQVVAADLGTGAVTPVKVIQAKQNWSAYGNLSNLDLIQLNVITLPACATQTNGSIGRNATGTYGCSTSGAWIKIF